MLIPHNSDVAMERVPWANWAIIAVTALVSALFWRNPDALDVYLVLRPAAGFSVWQLLGSQMAHANLFHLLTNMTILFALGNAINAKLGHGRYLLFYFGAGMLGDLCWLAFGGGPGALGASGCIMGVAGGFLALYPRNHISILSWQLVLLLLLLPVGLIVQLALGIMLLGMLLKRGVGSFEIPAYALILLYVATDLLLLRQGEFGGNLAHLGGFALGLVTALALLKAGVLTSPRYEENLLQALGLAPKAPSSLATIGAWKRRAEVAYAVPAARPALVRPARPAPRR